ncbi:MAG: helix-turn-helix domain-containing protein [Lentisphaeria bacterium]|nr:helix-turn-helix domain-containing protein [Lentisphaeria bacterium]
MAKLQQVLSDEIRKQTRKEISSLVKSLKCQIIDLRKMLQDYNQRLKQIEKTQSQAVPVFSKISSSDSPKKDKSFRVTPERIKKWRLKFGLSQAQYATLLGVNILSVNHWETGKAVPRQEQKHKITQLRDLGKRELAKLMAEKHISFKKRSARKSVSPQTVRRIHLSSEIAS